MLFYMFRLARTNFRDIHILNSSGYRYVDICLCTNLSEDGLRDPKYLGNIYFNVVQFKYPSIESEFCGSCVHNTVFNTRNINNAMLIEKF